MFQTNLTSLKGSLVDAFAQIPNDSKTLVIVTNVLDLWELQEKFPRATVASLGDIFYNKIIIERDVFTYVIVEPVGHLCGTQVDNIIGVLRRNKLVSVDTKFICLEK